MTNSPLPESFMFGVATADHQVEAYDPAFKDVRDEWDERRKLQLRGQATDFWQRYPEDIALAQQMGCKMFRFSVSWARIEPAPGQFNQAALAHYQQVVETIRAAGMEPVLTLHHFTWPLHVEERGGMIADEFPSLFAQYADVVVRHFGHLVRYWITFNEPTQLIYGYFKAGDYFMPPGLPPTAPLSEQMDKVQQLIRNLFEAHTRARTVIKAEQPDAMVGVNPWLLGLPTWARRFINWKATSLKEEDWNQQGWRFTERLPLWPRDVDLVIANVTVTAARAQQVDFSEVYYVDGLQLLVNIDSGIQGVADLANQRVAVVKSSRAASAIFTLMPAASDRIVANHVEGLDLLSNGQVAAMLADGSILEGLVDRYPGKYLVVGEKMTQEPYAVAVGKGNPALLGAVDAVVRNFRGTDRWVNSYQQHLPHRPVPPAPTVPTRATLSDLSNNGFDPSAAKLPLGESGTWLRKIQERGYLIVGVKDNVPGFGYRDPNTDEFSGLEIDLARSIAQTILGDSSKIRFRPVSTQERLPRLQSIFQIFDPILQGFSTLSTIFNSNWWYLGMAGQLPEFLCPAGCVNQLDFIGFDYYWGVNMFNLGKLGQLFSALRGDSQNSPVWPNGFYALIKENARLFPGMEIIIVENGCVPEADGIQRSDYLRRHIQQVQRAHQEGANVIAYLCWSITTNREWGLKLSPSSDFGLYSIDLDTDPDLQRLKTADVDVYQEIIRDRAG
jgi:beta-glucosidase/6-phospho-beta-glucosidase/beta-galactosidase/ABC-type amino acid transport substrate-binding protein